MKLIVNNNIENIDRESLTINELLDYKRFTFKMIVVKVNGKPIHKNDYATTYLNDGDNVQVIHLISGG
ncbi:MAG TPA: sulfur carrier protein ThiS [Bacteroidales bacterium]|jgi:thiamine biosynthesis protein ThiS|nr:sulfur carrier protein ThiS [Bacteroidales bacterium]HNV95530.1 sulfur carrier protein ThiS [Bacteroidales bacterium]HOU99059.1 sulfur carrier protein ThiS [Bacteroidales bacterium]